MPLGQTIIFDPPEFSAPLGDPLLSLAIEPTRNKLHANRVAARHPQRLFDAVVLDARGAIGEQAQEVV